jgi:predicted CXXCH cytochrome family protein
MKRLSQRIKWIALPGALFGLISIAEAGCALCSGATVALGDFDKEIINKAPEICVNCHPEKTRKPEHVVNVKVRSPITPPLPLFNGMVTCVTCHDPFGTSKNLLRYEKKILCTACHGNT